MPVQRPGTIAAMWMILSEPATFLDLHARAADCAACESHALAAHFFAQL
jgi:hypothetical protein